MLNKADYIESTKGYRRHLHQIPELGFCELKTSKFIREMLESFGYTVKVAAKTGLVAFRKGTESDETLAFRADMDALEISEETNVEFKSKISNQMHACGHDGHMSILLGFAKHVSTIKEVKKGILFIFQPAEEGPGGAKDIVQEGILTEFNVKHVFGIHLFPNIAEGLIGFKAGAMMAQTAEFDIYIEGKSGHGAMPHKANDAMIVVAQLINSYQSIISRNINPIEGAVITIGTISGGERRNVIAEKIILEGTLRAFDKEVYKTIKNRITTINKGLEEMYDVKITTKFIDMYPAVVNDKELVQRVREFIPKDKIFELDPMMLAEDFSYYGEQVPSIFFMLGTRNEKLGYINQLHSSKFNFNEEVLVEGIDLYHRICEGLGVY